MTDLDSPDTRPAFDLRRAPIEEAQSWGSRAHQQDAYAWTRVDGPDGLFLVAAVCDGMGAGSGSGVIAKDAASTAVHIAAAFGPDRLDTAINATRRIIDERHEERGENDNTTIVLATVDHAGVVRVAWVGDSRAYVVTDTYELVPLTTDHNLGRYGRPNVLTRTLLGLHEHDHESGDCERHTPEIATHDGPVLAVLLCTDGVHGALTDTQIRSLLLDAENASEAVGFLVEDAVDADPENADNATALVIDLGLMTGGAS